MFVEFNYDDFPNVYVTFGKLNSNNDFKIWVSNFKIKAINSGISESVVNQIMSEAVFIPKVIEYDSYQPEFYEDTFTYISKRANKRKVKKGHILSIEYKTYWDIRFDRRPNLDKIRDNLRRVIEETNSPKACNTLAEFSHAQKDKADEFKIKAARYYGQSANQGCLIGMHWLGVYYHEGFGVA